MQPIRLASLPKAESLREWILRPIEPKFWSYSLFPTSMTTAKLKVASVILEAFQTPKSSESIWNLCCLKWKSTSCPSETTRSITSFALSGTTIGGNGSDFQSKALLNRKTSLKLLMLKMQLIINKNKMLLKWVHMKNSRISIRNKGNKQNSNKSHILEDQREIKINNISNNKSKMSQLSPELTSQVKVHR